MKIVLNNTYTVLDGVSPYCIGEVANYYVPSFCKIMQNGRCVSKFKAKSKTFFNAKNSTIPTGLTGKLITVLKFNNCHWELADNRVVPKKQFDINHNLDLRSYQRKAHDGLVKAGRGICQIPTRGGKTEVMIKLVYGLGVKTLIIEPNRLLLYQTQQRFEKYSGIKHGLIGDSEYDPQDITIATVQSLHIKRHEKDLIKYLNTIECLLIDEAHHCQSGIKYYCNKDKKYKRYQTNSWYNMCMKIPAYYRFGFTATPGKDNDPERLHLEAVTGRLIYSIDTSTLIAEEYLTQPTIMIYSYDIKFPKEFEFNDWQEEYDYIIKSEKNNLIKTITDDFVKQNKTVLILVDRIDHGERLEMLIKNSIFLHGESTKSERQTFLEKLKNREISVLIGTIFGEGIDLPALDCVILGSPMASEKKQVQGLGRVLTIAKDKENAIIVDFKDTGKFTKQWFSKRLRIYKKEKEFIIIDLKTQRGTSGESV